MYIHVYLKFMTKESSKVILSQHLFYWQKGLETLDAEWSAFFYEFWLQEVIHSRQETFLSAVEVILQRKIAKWYQTYEVHKDIHDNFGFSCVLTLGKQKNVMMKMQIPHDQKLKFSK